MDNGSIIGLIGAWVIVVIAILIGGSILLFVDAPSVLIVIGGSTFAVMAKFDLKQFMGAFKAAAYVFRFPSQDKQQVIDKCVEMAQIARKEGALGLDGMEITDPFMAKGVGYLVDGVDTEVIEHILANEKQLAEDRHKGAIAVFKAFGDIGPAMGMIGTLVGLVQMLANMSDPKSIGPAMAVALLTTLYGALVANLLALPIADKLSVRSAEEAELRSLIMDSIINMSKGIHPRLVKESLDNFVETAQRKGEDDGKAAKAG